jgi:hypothetical protein
VTSTAFHFKLPDVTKLYKVTGTDDAATAKWYPLGTLKDNDFFEDHRDIIRQILGF